MTTDTYPKLATRKAEIDGVPVTINGIAKGAGMIAPDMATMLAFLFTDAAIEPEALACLARSRGRRAPSTPSPSTATPRPATRCSMFATGRVGRARRAAHRRTATISRLAEFPLGASPR